MYKLIFGTTFVDFINQQKIDLLKLCTLLFMTINHILFFSVTDKLLVMLQKLITLPLN